MVRTGACTLVIRRTTVFASPKARSRLFQETIGVRPDTDSPSVRVFSVIITTRRTGSIRTRRGLLPLRLLPNNAGPTARQSETQHALHLGVEHRFTEVAVFGRAARSFRLPTSMNA